MSVKNMYSIKDTVAEEFAPPFVANTDGVAVRMFSNALKGNLYPKDYELYCIGSFDVSLGCVASSVLRKLDVVLENDNEVNNV